MEHPRRHNRLELVLFPLAALGLAAYLHFALARLPDLDGLWHWRHAWVYLTHGLGYSDFPWLTCSVVRQYAADDWYGFHVLLLPFALLADPLLGVRLAGTCLTTAALLGVWWGLRMMRVRAAWLWPWVMVLGCPALTGRYAMVRPHVLSNVLGFLAVVVMVQGAPWQVALVAALFAFVHFNIIWMLPLLAGVVVAVRFAVTRRLELGRFAALLGGLVAGWLLRPHALGAAKLVVVQTLALFQARAQGVYTQPSLEMQPMDATFVHLNLVPLLALWLLVTGGWLWAGRRQRAESEERERLLLWSMFALAPIFLAMALVLGRRAGDQWLLFSFAFVALALTQAWGQPSRARWRKVRPAFRTALIALALLALAGNTARSVLRSQQATMHVLPDPTRLRAACEMLRSYGAPRTVVFSPHWEYFPELFCWNPDNYYITGIDTIFQYAYDPGLYWKTMHLILGDGATTCGKPECSPGDSEDTYTVLKRDFHAKYMILSRRDDYQLCKYAEQDPRFSMRYEDAEFIVVELVP